MPVNNICHMAHDSVDLKLQLALLSCVMTCKLIVSDAVAEAVLVFLPDLRQGPGAAEGPWWILVE